MSRRIELAKKLKTAAIENLGAMKAPVIQFLNESTLQNKYADLMEDYEAWKELQKRYGHINHLIEEINDTNWLLTGDHNHIEQEAW